MTEKPKAGFIISPIGEEGSEVRKHADDVLQCIIEPALESFGLRAVRADQMVEPGKITHQMIQAILQYDLCIAVLTGQNANVFYEVAVAQAARRPLVLMIEKGQKLPFDVQDLRVVEYDLQPMAIYKGTWTEEVTKHIQAVLSPDHRPPTLGDAALFSISEAREPNLGMIRGLDDDTILSRYREAEVVRMLSLAGSQFARLGTQAALSSLFDMRETKMLQIILGDPKSHEVQLRYGSGFGEPDTYETGIEGIDRRLVSFYHKWTRANKNDQEKIEIRVFPGYPTLSLVQIDQEIYSASYGCKLRGGDCPRIRTIVDSPYADFLLRHFQNVLESSRPLAEWIREHHPSETEID